MDLSNYNSLVDQFNFKWSDVVSAFWKRYPNQFSKHVLTEDVLERKIMQDGKLYTRRVLSKNNPLPKWGGLVFPSHLRDVAHILEESVVDPMKKSMVVYSWNINFKNMMDVQEKMLIQPKENATSVVREGWVDSSFTGFRRVLRKFGSHRWLSNAKKSQVGFQHILSNAISPGVQKINLSLKEQSIDIMKDTAKQKAKNIAHKLGGQVS